MQAQVTAHRDFTVSQIDDRLYGAFVEHLGRGIYTGIYEPGHPTADGNGFRGDVIELVRALAVPVVRYPGGNFVSAYNWEDGIGPREQRPVRLDLAWRTRETNEVGLHEFADWCAAAGTEMMMAVNLGSRGLDAARNLLEYCNHSAGSYWSDLRAKNGRREPWNVKLWCLGNEMDGPWQVGHKSAAEYGHLANETAKAMKAFDRSLELVVCGSSHSNMATYPEWEATVLDICYENTEYISLHMYFTNYENDVANYLALNEKLDRYIGTVAGVIDYTKGKKRSNRTVAISFDEWNVWYHSRLQDREKMASADWPTAPHLLEDIYNFEDALQVACIINTFIRRSDRVRIACLAQLVNVIAPIMTEPGGGAWRQTTYYPFWFASRFGRGTALNLLVRSPSYDAENADGVPYLDIAAVHDADNATLSLFAVNRHPRETLETAVSLQGFGAPRVIDHQVMQHPDLKATNSVQRPDAVVPQAGNPATVRIEEGGLHARLAPLSYQMIRLAV